MYNLLPLAEWWYAAPEQRHVCMEKNTRSRPVYYPVPKYEGGDGSTQSVIAQLGLESTPFRATLTYRPGFVGTRSLGNCCSTGGAPTPVRAHPWKHEIATPARSRVILRGHNGIDTGGAPRYLAVVDVKGGSTMVHATLPPHQPQRTVSRWPAAVALVLIGVGYLFVSDRFSIGPPWLVLLLVAVFLVPINITRRLGALHFTRALILGIIALVTVAVVTSALFLVAQLVGGSKTPAPVLLRDGGVIWVANVIVFALWYWEIDCGGPAQRILGPYQSTDFLFPQRSLDATAYPDWSPEFVDYLFLAFNTSAAFSPTDVLILSRPAKGLMMVQSLISIVIIAVLIARAINTLS